MNKSLFTTFQVDSGTYITRIYNFCFNTVLASVYILCNIFCIIRTKALELFTATTKCIMKIIKKTELIIKHKKHKTRAGISLLDMLIYVSNLTLVKTNSIPKDLKSYDKLFYVTNTYFLILICAEY